MSLLLSLLPFLSPLDATWACQSLCMAMRRCVGNPPNAILVSVRDPADTVHKRTRSASANRSCRSCSDSANISDKISCCEVSVRHANPQHYRHRQRPISKYSDGHYTRYTSTDCLHWKMSTRTHYSQPRVGPSFMACTKVAGELRDHWSNDKKTSR